MTCLYLISWLTIPASKCSSTFILINGFISSWICRNSSKRAFPMAGPKEDRLLRFWVCWDNAREQPSFSELQETRKSSSHAMLCQQPCLSMVAERPRDERRFEITVHDQDRLRRYSSPCPVKTHINATPYFLYPVHLTKRQTYRHLFTMPRVCAKIRK